MKLMLEGFQELTQDEMYDWMGGYGSYGGGSGSDDDSGYGGTTGSDPDSYNEPSAPPPTYEEPSGPDAEPEIPDPDPGPFREAWNQIDHLSWKQFDPLTDQLPRNTVADEWDFRETDLNETYWNMAWLYRDPVTNEPVYVTYDHDNDPSTPFLYLELD